MKTTTPLIAAALAMLVGCAASTKPITTPSGKTGFYVSCDGSASDWATCYEAAIKACGAGYNVIDRNESSTPTPYGPMVRRHMIAECKG